MREKVEQVNSEKDGAIARLQQQINDLSLDVQVRISMNFRSTPGQLKNVPDHGGNRTFDFWNVMPDHDGNRTYDLWNVMPDHGGNRTYDFWNVMPDHDGNRTYDLWNVMPDQRRESNLRPFSLLGVDINSENTTNIIFSGVHNIMTFFEVMIYNLIR